MLIPDKNVHGVKLFSDVEYQICNDINIEKC
jgi:hypothetical protein